MLRMVSKGGMISLPTVAAMATRSNLYLQYRLDDESEVDIQDRVRRNGAEWKHAEVPRIGEHGDPV